MEIFLINICIKARKLVFIKNVLLTAKVEHFFFRKSQLIVNDDGNWNAVKELKCKGRSFEETGLKLQCVAINWGRKQ